MIIPQQVTLTRFCETGKDLITAPKSQPLAKFCDEYWHRWDWLSEHTIKNRNLTLQPVNLGCRSWTSVLTDTQNFLQLALNIKALQDNLWGSGWCFVLLTEHFINQCLLMLKKNWKLLKVTNMPPGMLWTCWVPLVCIIPSQCDHCQNISKLKTATCHYCVVVVVKLDT